MNKKVLSLLLAVVLLVSLLPMQVHAAGAQGTWNVSLKVEKNTNVKYQNQDTVQLGFAVQSDDLKVSRAAGIGFVVDLNMFDLVYDNGEGTAESFDLYQPDRISSYDYFVNQKYTLGRGPNAIKWDADAYIRREGNKAYILLQPYCAKATDCSQEIVLASVLLGLKPGKSMDYANSDSIRWMTAEESARCRQSSVIEITDGGENTQNWRFTDTSKPNTLKSSPKVNLVGFKAPVLKSKSKALSLENIIQIRYYFTYNGTESPDYLKKNGGILVWINDQADYVPGTESYRVEGLEKDSNGVFADSRGIPAKRMSDVQHVCAYLKLRDGTTVYSNVTAYSPQQYVMRQLGRNPAKTFHDLLCSIMNYGAAAQIVFDYRADDLMNAGLTAEEQKVNYDSSMLIPRKSIDPAKTFEKNPQVRYTAWSLNIEGVISPRLYSSIDPELAKNAQEMGVAYWYETQYNKVSKLTLENASGRVTALGEDPYGTYADFPGYPAKRLGETYYACTYVKDANGQVHFSELRSYSAHVYAKNKIEKHPDQVELADFCKAMVVYSHSAKVFFGK